MKDFIVKYFCGDKISKTDKTNEDLGIFISRTGDRIKVQITAKKEIKIQSVKTFTPFMPKKQSLLFFNGYQSWTDTKEFYPYETMKSLNRLPKKLVDLYAFDRYGDSCFYKYQKSRMHGYDIFYCRYYEELFILNHNYKRANLLIEYDKTDKILNLKSHFNGLKLQSGEDLAAMDFYVGKSYEAGMEYFKQAFPQKGSKKLFGYTSWYNYYQNINEQIILRDLSGLKEGFDLFQIDDGYEEYVGDWLCIDKKKFPNGLETIVQKIHDKNLLAGIWLAPFVAETNSRLFKTRPELFLKDKNGDFVKCGSNWSGFYALDMQNQEAKDYVKSCLYYFIKAGFDFFKLDFLYAASICPKEGVSRSMAAEDAYDFLRECLKDKLILGCGATLFNCIDKFDYVRIGPDVSLKFDDVWYMRFMHRERISTKTTLQNTIYRSLFDARFFGNDPDVFLLRDDNINLSDRQKMALFTINALFGSIVMTSDNVGDYDDRKKQILSNGLELFKKARIQKVSRYKDIITIEYTLNGKAFKIDYNTKKGVLV